MVCGVFGQEEEEEEEKEGGNFIVIVSCPAASGQFNLTATNCAKKRVKILCISNVSQSRADLTD